MATTASLLPPSLASSLAAGQAALAALRAHRLAELEARSPEAPTSSIALPPYSDVRDTLSAGATLHQLRADLEALPSAHPSLGERVTDLAKDAIAVEARRFVLESLPGVTTPATGADLTDQVAEILFDRLDLVLALDENGLIDTSLPLIIVEDLFESLPISSCSRLFAYLESRVGALTVGLHPSKGKGLTLLRACNDLLRRLSRPDRPQTIFAGRVLSLLSGVFPLGERSGVNLRGDFNVDNTTIVEPVPELSEGREEGDGGADAADGGDANMATDGDGGAVTAEEAASKETSVDIPAPSSRESRQSKRLREAELDKHVVEATTSGAFYLLFWSLQAYFSNPSLLFDANAEPPQASELAAAFSKLSGALKAVHKDPAPEGAKGTMVLLRRTTRLVLRAFAVVAQREKELAGGDDSNAPASGSSIPATTSQHTTAGAQLLGDISIGSKRLAAVSEDDGPARKKRATANGGSVEAGSDEVGADEGSDFFAKFLTGRKLLDYELRDAAFRRHVLVQFLILFQYLLGFNASAREKWKDWKNKPLQSIAFVLDESDDRWIRDVWREVLSLLKDIPPDGKTFSDSVLQALRREARWISWKTENCPPIDRPPVSAEQLIAFATARSNALRPQREWPHALGTAALSSLWEDGMRPPEGGTRKTEDEEGNEIEIAFDGLDDLEMPPRVPDLRTYARLLQLQDNKANQRRSQLGWDAPTPAPGPQERDKEAAWRQQDRERQKRERGDATLESIVEAKQSLSWRALRVAQSSHLHLFSKIRVDDVGLLMQAIEEEKRRPPPAPAPTSAQKPQQANVKAEAEAEAEASPAPVAVPVVPGSAAEKEVQEKEAAERKAEEGDGDTGAEAEGVNDDALKQEDTEVKPVEGGAVNENEQAGGDVEMKEVAPEEEAKGEDDAGGEVNGAA